VLWQISATSFSGLLPATFTGARLHNALAAPPITAVGAHAGLLVDGAASFAMLATAFCRGSPSNIIADMVRRSGAGFALDEIH
jgi:hypothetical protein